VRWGKYALVVALVGVALIGISAVAALVGAATLAMVLLYGGGGTAIVVVLAWVVSYKLRTQKTATVERGAANRPSNLSD
jgi:hypothetical protein